MRWSWSRPAARPPSWRRSPSAGCGASGAQSRQTLADYGVTTIGQLAALPEGTLRRRFGTHGARPGAAGARYRSGASGDLGRRRRAIGHELTFNHDVDDPARLEATLLDLAESVASRLREPPHGGRARCSSSCATRASRRSPGRCAAAAPDARLRADLRSRRRPPAQDAGRADRAVRLIGLTAINLTDVQQLTLFDEPDKTDRITKSIDAVRERFGEKAITRARLIGHGDHRRPRLRETRSREVPHRTETLDKSNTCSYARSPIRTPVRCLWQAA